MYGIKTDWQPAQQPRIHFLEDYEAGTARWCAGCGDHAVLTSIQKLCRDEQLPPEDTVFVSGIGCASRFPHYMNTYGFHSLHGRAFPVAMGIKARRPDLHVFAITGDGDCCAIGTAHWIHAIRYNMDITILMFDNNIYGLTKGQTSPTTRIGEKSATHPRGAFIAPLNPTSIMLGIDNASFIAQTVDWNPPHLAATIKKAYEHKGTSFVRVFQRCPHFTPHVFQGAQQDPNLVRLLDHPDGVVLDDNVKKMFKNTVEHDPTDLNAARELAQNSDVYTIGLFYKNDEALRLDEHSVEGLGMRIPEKVNVLDGILDGFAI